MEEENKEKIKKKKKFNFGLARINNKQRDFFMENLTILLESGMDILSALQALKTEVSAKGLVKTIEEIEQEVEAGMPFYQALEKTNVASSQILYLLKVGEQSGNLVENLKVIAQLQENKRKYNSKIKSATLYPMIVFILTLVIAGGTSIFVLPQLSEIFNQLETEVPWSTKILMQLGELFRYYGVFIVLGFTLFIFAFIFFFFIFPKTKFLGQTILILSPLTKTIVIELELSRFGFVLGTLLQSGLPIVESLSYLEEMASSFYYRELYVHIKEKIALGETFQESFASYSKTRKIMPVYIQNMIFTSEKTGHLPETLLKIGKMFEAKIENSIKNLITMLEPLMIVVIGLGVLFLAFSMITPLYSLYDAV